MRRLLPVVALALITAVAGGQDPAPEEAAGSSAAPVDELGFPITFDAEILTQQDILRALGAKASDLGNRRVLRNERDSVLRTKLAERVAADLGVEVTAEEVDLLIRREIEEAGGDAKFAERMAQRGDTLARHEEDVRGRILGSKLAYLFQYGVFQRHLLPQRIRPTPREIRIAWEADPERRAAGIRVRCTRVRVALTRAERGDMARLTMEGRTKDEVAKRKLELLEPRLAKVVAAVEAGPPDALAELEAVTVEAGWEQVSRDRSDDPSTAFLQTAAPGARAEPLLEPDGNGYLILVLHERASGDREPSDPEVAAAYDLRIRTLRARKWEALLSLRALDAATVRPERVREEMRQQLVAELRAAEQGLRVLDLH